MKKKAVKKSVAPKAEELNELPKISIKEDDDVDEDHPVFDMSSVPTPVIAEFELPKMKKEKTTKKEEKTKKVGKKATETLTAEKLNDEITKVRSVIATAKTRLMSKLVRKKKDFEAKCAKAKDEKKKEQFERHATRLGEELESFGGLDRDTVAKFAFLNQKGVSVLIGSDTSPSERLMYKLACHELLLKEVEELREKYIDFNKSAAFFMQRLGLQYSNKASEKEEKKTKKELENEKKKKVKEEKSVEKDDDLNEDGAEASEKNDSDNDEEDDEDDDEDGDGSSFDMSDVEMMNSDDEEEDEAVQKRRALLLGLIGSDVDKNRPAIKPKKRKIVDDENEVAPETAFDKKSKKEIAKNEMKKAFEKELKATEAKKPKIEKKSNKKKTEKAVPEKNPEKVIPIDESEPQTLIKRINLSAGGKIEKKSQQVEKKKENVEKEIEEGDEEENAFFLPKAGEVENPKSKIMTRSKSAVNKTPKSNALDEKKKKGSSKKPTLTGEMHPSWAASQQKKKEMQHAKPCGKKTTFEDDD